MLLLRGMKDCYGVGADLGGVNFSRVFKDLLDLQEQKGLQATRQVSYHSLFICPSLHTQMLHFFLCLFPTTYSLSQLLSPCQL